MSAVRSAREQLTAYLAYKSVFTGMFFFSMRHQRFFVIEIQIAYTAREYNRRFRFEGFRGFFHNLLFLNYLPIPQYRFLFLFPSYGFAFKCFRINLLKVILSIHAFRLNNGYVNLTILA